MPFIKQTSWAFCSLGLVGMARWQAQNALWELIGCLALVGMGRALFQAPNKSAVLGAAPGEYQGSASTLLATAWEMGSGAVRKRDLTGIRYIVYSMITIYRIVVPGKDARSCGGKLGHM